MRILQIGTIDKAGGAAQVSWDLKTELEKRGHFVSMFVQDKVSQDPRVFKIPPTFPRQGIVSRILADDIDFYKTDYILKTKEFKEADIIHCHNLHGYFFKLDTLRKMAKQKPVIWTLHDMWAISSHCAYPPENSLKNGFYHCPELHHYAQIEWHNEKYLMFKKRKVYQATKINLVTPSAWLKNLVSQSVLKDKAFQVINNGVDTSVFKPLGQSSARKELGLPLDKKIVLFLASGGTTDSRKGWIYALEMIQRFSKGNVLFLCVGGDKEDKTNTQQWMIPGLNDREAVAKYFSASDVFLFSSLADNFPLTILESMACGTPVVAFDTGGVKEEIIHLETGYIAEQKNSNDLYQGLKFVLDLEPEKLEFMRQECVRRVAENFTIEKMADNYLNLYQSLTR